MAKQVCEHWTTLLVGLLFSGGLAVAGWLAIGPDHFVYAVVSQVGFMFTGLLIGPILVDVARIRYPVAPTEARIFTFLGSGLLLSFLRAIGWNNVIAKMRQQRDGTIAPRQFLRGTELSETGHLIGLVATAILVMIAALASHPRGATQVLLIGVLLHAYPVMIQRMLRIRIVGPRADVRRND